VSRDDLGDQLRHLDDTMGDSMPGGPSVPRRSRKKDDPRLFHRIHITGELPRMTHLAWNALTAFNNPPVLFTVADRPARIKQGKQSGHTTVEDLSIDSMTHYSARSAFWYKQAGGNQGMPGIEIEQPPPPVVMHDMLADPEPPLPPLNRITRAPAFSTTGALSTAPGYHEGSCHYYAARGLDVADVPAQPTREAIDAALDFLLVELLSDFPFAGPQDGLCEAAHAISAMLNPFVRDMIDGPTPMYLIEAPTAGSGKGLLAHVLMLPALGGPPVLMPDAQNEEELRKRLMGTLMALPEAIVLDNIASSLDSPSLAAALTAREFTDRVLGRSEIRTIPVTCTWLATGNNPSKSGEMARRTIRIRIDAQTERPEERGNFRHADLEAWTREHRGEIVHAILTIVQGWIAAGKPQGTQVLGSYGAWSAVHGGILDFLGVKGFLGNRNEDRILTVSEDAAWSMFVDAWWAEHRDKPVKVADLFDLAVAIDGFPLGSSPTPRGQRSALGQALSRNRNRIYGGRAITYAGVSHNAAAYRLVSPEPDF
jgi:hypothetical protein